MKLSLFNLNILWCCINKKQTHMLRHFRGFRKTKLLPKILVRFCNVSYANYK